VFKPPTDLMRSLLAVPLLLLSTVPTFAEPWQPADDPASYHRVMKMVEASEDYSHFLATEKRAIDPLSDEYLQVRWTYFRELHLVNPDVAAPKKPLAVFMKQCRDMGWLKKSEDAAFNDAATAVGLELITDKCPVKISEDAITITRDLPYAKYGSYQPKLDLFLPKNPSQAKLPCIVFLHDGAWAVHKRAWFECHARIAAREGFAAVNVDYRLLPGVTPPDCVNDAKAAVRWVRANAAKYGLDPDRIGASGASAGAQLATLLGTSAEAPELEGNGGNAEFSSKVQAVVGMCTPAMTGRATWPILKGNAPPWFKQISPYEHAGSGDAPMLLLHGTNDTLVSPDESKDLSRKLQDAGVPCEVRLYEGKGHVFYMSESIGMDLMGFFKRTLAPASAGD
jgi:acetyl esterase/lipase